MPAAWRLAINSLSGRLSRSLLLIAAVALSSALIAAVSSAMASLDAALLQRAKVMLGSADLRIHHPSGGTFDSTVAQIASRWPEVAIAIPRARDSLALHDQRSGKQDALLVFGIDPALEPRVRAFDLVSGRLVQGDGEILLDEKAAATLDARTGDILDVVRFGEPATLTVVGIVKPPAAGRDHSARGDFHDACHACGTHGQDQPPYAGRSHPQAGLRGGKGRLAAAHGGPRPPRRGQHDHR